MRKRSKQVSSLSASSRSTSTSSGSAYYLPALDRPLVVASLLSHVYTSGSGPDGLLSARERLTLEAHVDKFHGLLHRCHYPPLSSICATADPRWRCLPPRMLEHLRGNFRTLTSRGSIETV